MSPLYDPKVLPESLELDYFQRPRAFHRWLRRCCWTAGGIAVAYVLWATLVPANRTMLEAGPVSTSHAMFSQDCGKCHMSTFATATRLAPGHQGEMSTPDAACLVCHPGQQDHNRCVKAESCATCHKEHRGQTLLARPGDGHCTDCHDRLTTKYGTECREFVRENVGSIASHPEFALWRGKKVAVDPGNIEFNHSKHLHLRMEDKLAKIEGAVLKLQELQCAYCHQPDAAGKYMAPIEFDKHCQECHALLLPLKADPVLAAFKPAVLAFLTQPVPHPQKGETAWQVRANLRERYLKFAQSNADVLKLPRVPREEWMVLPGLAKQVEPATQGQIDWVNERWRLAESLFFDKDAGCVHCHKGIASSGLGVDGLPDFGEPQIPSRWFKHSVFDHHAHRMLTCVSCHAKWSEGDAAKDVLESTSRADVLIPKVANCQACHQPSSGFARADCVECHRFHNRNQPAAWQGGLTIKSSGGSEEH